LSFWIPENFLYTEVMTDKEIKMLIAKYIHHPVVTQTYKNFKSIDSDGIYPSMIYFGLNFCDKKVISFKIYFAVYKRLSDAELSNLLPVTDDFKRYYHLWAESKVRNEEHTGCTFEIKFKNSDKPTYGFHYRLNPTQEAYELIGTPKMLGFDISSENTRPGINYEYEPDRILRKRYYYIKSPHNKQIIAKRFNYDYATQAAFIEYTESDAFAKINIWNPNFTIINLNRPSVFSDEENAIINFIKKEYGVINISDGLYEDGKIKATYFFDLKGNAEYPFIEPENLKIDTLKLFYS
jgi:hypothetical protein